MSYSVGDNVVYSKYRGDDTYDFVGTVDSFSGGKIRVNFPAQFGFDEFTQLAWPRELHKLSEHNAVMRRQSESRRAQQAAREAELEATARRAAEAGPSTLRRGTGWQKVTEKSLASRVQIEALNPRYWEDRGERRLGKGARNSINDYIIENGEQMVGFTETPKLLFKKSDIIEYFSQLNSEGYLPKHPITRRRIIDPSEIFTYTAVVPSSGGYRKKSRRTRSKKNKTRRGNRK